MLEVTDLSARAGSFVLSNVSLAVRPSSCHVILGPTGSGKTLLLESIIGLRSPKAGTVILEGKDITCLPMEQRGLSYVPQDLSLFPHMTVRDNILYPLRIRGGARDIENGIVGELVDSLGIRHLLDRSVQNLSGGERQRTALARAVASGCKYLILDEPLSALHESLKKELWYLLKDLQRRYNLAMLMVTHDLEEAFFMGDEMSVVLDGITCQQGRRDDVYGHPATVEVARFLGIRNIFAVKTQRMNGESVMVHCETLGTNLAVLTPTVVMFSEKNARFFLGIRSENITILLPGETSPDFENVVEGVVMDTFENGALCMLIVARPGTSVGIEAVVPRVTAQELGLSRGMPIVLHLPKESLFPMANPTQRDSF